MMWRRSFEWLKGAACRQQQNAELPHVWYGTLYQNVSVHHNTKLFSFLQPSPSELNDMLSSFPSNIINCRYGVLFWVWGNFKSKCESWLFRGVACCILLSEIRGNTIQGDRGIMKTGYDTECIQLEYQGLALATKPQLRWNLALYRLRKRK